MNINYGRHYIDNSDIKSVVKQLKGSQITQGITVKKFEDMLKKKNLKRGTALLRLVVQGLFILISLAYGWKKGDLIFYFSLKLCSYFKLHSLLRRYSFCRY